MGVWDRTQKSPIYWKEYQIPNLHYSMINFQGCMSTTNGWTALQGFNQIDKLAPSHLEDWPTQISQNALKEKVLPVPQNRLVVIQTSNDFWFWAWKMQAKNIKNLQKNVSWYQQLACAQQQIINRKEWQRWQHGRQRWNEHLLKRRDWRWRRWV